jgi:hypothetical protein
MPVIIVILSLSVLVFCGWVIWVILGWRKWKFKNDLQNKLIERFNTAPELTHFLQSNVGTRFMNFLLIEGMGPKEKLITSISEGVILSIVGIAFIFIGPLLAELTQQIRIFQALGIVSISLGIGLLVSGFISYHLSKHWGIIDTE